MTPEDSTKLLDKYARRVRNQWLKAVRSVDLDPAALALVADQFSAEVIRLAVDAGYKEARYIGGVFDPTAAADRFQEDRMSVRDRFIRDGQLKRPGISMGLSPKQADDVAAFQSLLRTSNTPLPGETMVVSRRDVRRQVKTLERKFLNTRAELIGNTVGNAALGLGVDAAVEQTTASTGQAIERTWLTASDEKVRSSHGAMHGMTRQQGQPFTSGNGYQLRYPGDPRAPVSERAHCRCIVTTKPLG